MLESNINRGYERLMKMTGSNCLLDRSYLHLIMRKGYICFTAAFIITLLSCTHKSAAPALHIALTTNHTLKFTGLDQAILNDIARDSDAAVWQIFIPVCKMPADTDMKSYQPAQPGKYTVNNGTIIFIPDTPFVKGRAYFVRYPVLNNGISLSDYLKGHINLGRPRFADLVFMQGNRF